MILILFIKERVLLFLCRFSFCFKLIFFRFGIFCVTSVNFLALLCRLKIINKMSSSKIVYSVRVLFSYPIMKEKTYVNLTWEEAVQRFDFFVQCCLAFPELHVRCVNIIKGKRKSIKMFQNHE